MLASAIAEARPDLPRALEIVNAAIEHHGEKAELLLKQAQVLMRLRRRVEGVAAARRAAEICPPDARLLQAIAKVHVEWRNEPAEAKPLLQRARELLPTDPRSSTIRPCATSTSTRWTRPRPCSSEC